MNHLSISCAALLASCLTAKATAQDHATSLMAAARSADIVVRATVVLATDPDPSWHRLQFHSEQVLKGQIGAYFSLLEPAGKCCGRSLFALTTGDTRLLFLRRTGLSLHPFGGARGVVPATAAIVAHTTALLAATTEPMRAQLLAANLGNPEPRIAEDAAHALATLPTLQLSQGDRAAVTTALTLAVQRGSSRTASLVDVAARLADAAMIDALLPIYLSAGRSDQARLLRSALTRCPAPLVANRLPQFVGNDARGNLRAAELLTRLPSAQAQAAMNILLQRDCHPRVKMQLCQGLLTAGVNPAALRRLVPEAVVRLAEQRNRRRRAFRNLSPQR